MRRQHLLGTVAAGALLVAFAGCETSTERADGYCRGCQDKWAPECLPECGIEPPATCPEQCRSSETFTLEECDVPCTFGAVDVDAGTGGADSGMSGGTGGMPAGNGGESGAGGTGGSGNASGTGPDADTCDPAASPADESCLVSDEHAVFVAPSGAMDAPGTQNEPLASISEAAGVAAEGDKIVIVCNDTYDEQVTVEAGVRVYGGFACPHQNNAWQPVADGRPLVAPASGSALHVDQVDGAVIIEGIDFESADATEPGGSSIAARVVESMDVTLRQVTLSAGAGADGRDGQTDPINFPDRETELDGQAGNEGGAGGAHDCEGGSTSGGKGGEGEQAGGNGTPAYDDTSGKGGMVGVCNPSAARGADAPPQPDAPGASAVGTIDSNTWQPASGQDGEIGKPGQGGGGGAGSASGNGGGGGAGGCGGAGGQGGQGGGASIALLSVDSSVTLEAATLKTSNAGAGGDGSPGQEGQRDEETMGGGFGGLPGGSGACSGGNGGAGGRGGDGGGGAGGVSVGIVHQGLAPQRQDVTIELGTAGPGGFGGGAAEGDGVEGVSQQELDVS